MENVPQLGQVDPMVLVTKNRLDGLPIQTYDQIGQGRINNPNTPLNYNLYNLWALVTNTIGHPLHQVK